MLFTPAVSAAKSTGPTISYVPRADLSSLCSIAVPEGDRLFGCFRGNGENQIYIDSSLIGSDKDFVYWHETGHYLMECADLTRFNGDRELAANTYGLWKTFPRFVSADNAAYFASVEAGKFVCKKHH